MKLLEGWTRGEPAHYRVSTVLNGVPLSGSVETRQGIRLIPLPLTTTRLPRLPTASYPTPRDYLGLTLLTLERSASPALFCPGPADEAQQTVHSNSVDDTDFDIVCQALSLQTNCYVSWSIVWNDYLEATPFCLPIPDHWWRSAHGVERLRWKRETRNWETGEVTIQPEDELVARSVDGEELENILRRLRGADKKIRIAVGRWIRSKIPEGRTSLEDRFIDLRVALELLFLKNFRGGQDQEMSFRMSLFGAWYLAKSPDERQSIGKALRQAYSAASRAVHLGEVRENQQEMLSVAQDLCRRGILKLLREGPPSNWSQLILGADGSQVRESQETSA